MLLRVAVFREQRRILTHHVSVRTRMMNWRLVLVSLLVTTGSAFAHPGHGKPGFYHAHTWAQLADWLANAALMYLGLFAAGVACWKACSLLRRTRS